MFQRLFVLVNAVSVLQQYTGPISGTLGTIAGLCITNFGGLKTVFMGYYLFFLYLTEMIRGFFFIEGAFQRI